MKPILVLLLTLGSVTAAPTPTPAPSAAPTIEQIRVQKEAALLIAKDITPVRAKLKMEELLSQGIPISPATQAAVNRMQPTPTPGLPSPKPLNDGL